MGNPETDGASDIDNDNFFFLTLLCAYLLLFVTMYNHTLLEFTHKYT